MGQQGRSKEKPGGRSRPPKQQQGVDINDRFKKIIAKAKSKGENVDLLSVQRVFKGRDCPALAGMLGERRELRIRVELILHTCTVMTYAHLLSSLKAADVHLEMAGVFNFRSLEVGYKWKTQAVEKIFGLQDYEGEPFYDLEMALADVVEYACKRGSMRGNYDRASLESYLVQRWEVPSVTHLGILLERSMPFLLSLAKKSKSASASGRASLVKKSVKKANLLLKNLEKEVDGMRDLVDQFLADKNMKRPMNDEKMATLSLAFMQRLRDALLKEEVTPRDLGLAVSHSRLVSAVSLAANENDILCTATASELFVLEDLAARNLEVASFADASGQTFLSFVNAAKDEIWPPDQQPAIDRATSGSADDEDERLFEEATRFVRNVFPDWLLCDLSRGSCEDSSAVLCFAEALGYCQSLGCLSRDHVVRAIDSQLSACVGSAIPTCLSDLRARARIPHLPDEDESTGVIETVTAIRKVPFLADIETTIGWSRNYLSTHGPLPAFLSRHFSPSDSAFTVTGTIVVPLDRSATLASLRSALGERDGRRTAIAILSLLHSREPEDDISLTLQSHDLDDEDFSSFLFSVLMAVPAPENQLTVYELFAPLATSHRELIASLDTRARAEGSGLLLALATLKPEVGRIHAQLAASAAPVLAPAASATTSAPAAYTLESGAVATPVETADLSRDTPEQHEEVANGDRQAAQAVVSTIRRRWTAGSVTDATALACIEDYQNTLMKTITSLSEDIYGSSDRFLMELIQNADDNSYPSESTPSLSLNILPGGLLLRNNELGFSEVNVRSLCDVRSSSKANKAGFIGEKGIGFKAVFKVSEAPEIHSNGFHFAFDTLADGTLGYICPTWRGEPSAEVAQVFASDGDAGTTLYLPWKKEGEKNWPLAVEKELRALSSSVILFLTKLRCLEILSGDGGVIRVVEKTVENTTVMTERPGLLSASASFVTVTEQRDSSKRQHWWIYEEEVAMSSARNKQARTRISVAFPLSSRAEGLLLSPGTLPPQDVCAFLPMKSFGFRFMLQADFSLVSSREALKEGDAWNQELLRRIPDVFLSAYQHLRAGSEPSISFESNHILNRFVEFLPTETTAPFDAVARKILSLFRDEQCVPVKGDDGLIGFYRPSALLLAPSLSDAATADLRLVAEMEGRRLLLSADVHPSHLRILTLLGVPTIDDELLVNRLHDLHRQYVSGYAEAGSGEAEYLQSLCACLRIWHEMRLPVSGFASAPVIPVSSSEGLRVLTVSEAAAEKIFLSGPTDSKLREVLTSLPAVSTKLQAVHGVCAADNQLCELFLQCKVTKLDRDGLLRHVVLPCLEFDSSNPEGAVDAAIDAQILATWLALKSSSPMRPQIQTSQSTRATKFLTIAGDMVPAVSLTRERRTYNTKGCHLLSDRYAEGMAKVGLKPVDLFDLFEVPKTFALVLDAVGKWKSPELVSFALWCDTASQERLKAAVSPAQLAQDWAVAYRRFQKEPVFLAELLEQAWYITTIGATRQAVAVCDLQDAATLAHYLSTDSLTAILDLFPCRPGKGKEEALVKMLVPSPPTPSLDFLCDMVATRWSARGGISQELWSHEGGGNERETMARSSRIMPLVARVYHRLMTDAKRADAAWVRGAGEESPSARVCKKLSGKSILRVTTKGADVSFVKPRDTVLSDPTFIVDSLPGGKMVIFRYYTSKITEDLTDFFAILGVTQRPSLEEYVQLLTDAQCDDTVVAKFLTHLPELSRNSTSASKAALSTLRLPCHDGRSRVPAECCWSPWEDHPVRQWDECPFGVLSLSDCPGDTMANIASVLGIRAVDQVVEMRCDGLSTYDSVAGRVLSRSLSLMQRWLSANLPVSNFAQVEAAAHAKLAGSVTVAAVGNAKEKMEVTVMSGCLRGDVPCEAISLEGESGTTLYASAHAVVHRNRYEAFFGAFLRSLGCIGEEDVVSCARQVQEWAREIGIHLDEPSAYDDVVSEAEFPTLPSPWSMDCDDSLVTAQRSHPSFGDEEAQEEEEEDDDAEKCHDAMARAEDIFESLTKDQEELEAKLAAMPRKEVLPSALPGGISGFVPGTHLAGQAPVEGRAALGGGQLGPAGGGGMSGNSGVSGVSGASSGVSGGMAASPALMLGQFQARMQERGSVTVEAFEPTEDVMTEQEVLSDRLVGGQCDEEAEKLVSRLGEELAAAYLRKQGYADVCWVHEKGETGAPYDATYTDPRRGKVFVEVKTSRLPASNPHARSFEVSANEAAKMQNETYGLLRVCNVLSRPVQMLFLPSTKEACDSGRLALMGLLGVA